MARSSTRPKRPQKGHIEELPSGALRVHVYAGTDALTGKRLDLKETIPAGPDAAEQADAALIRLLHEVNERRNPKTNATVRQLFEKYFKHYQGEETTKRTEERHVKNHILPLIGDEKARRVDADLLESLYAELQRCRLHCTNPNFIEHRTSREHVCDARCHPHECEPLGAWTIRKIHFIISGAFERARKIWKWVSANPAALATPPPPPPSDPRPPSPQEAARILNEAWKDLAFGVLVWVLMVTGARRGEICGLRWKHFEPERGVLVYRRAAAQDGKDLWDKDTKTHQIRRVALDAETVALLVDFKKYCEQLAAAAGLTLSPESFIFSLAPDGSTQRKPRSLTQRYNRLVERLGIDTTIKQLRHYSATELIAAGVDIRTVAGRLGHAGGGTTTLKVYAAFVAEADQRASQTLLSRVPKRPEAPPDPLERAKTNPQAPYEEVAASLRLDILHGVLPADTPAPSVKEVAQAHGVSIGTAHRVHGLLRSWGLLSEGGRGRRPLIIRPADPAQESVSAAPVAESTPMDLGSAATSGEALLDLRLLALGEEVKMFKANADPANPTHLERLLRASARRHGGADVDLDDYELEVRLADTGDLVTTFAAL
ncbi:tyrosine-type recombinase/integrase [Amycolatopsis anabasis]|uniref:tyrosine-type recombinase/integrase n=1 Tax=Amycolatopsis anabasis TaxID=1840409 RepID=UPI00131D94DC|nr:tyrosine-type recombinase/integrase [Amycolatopsis anabasis]